ncbi:hypothetical protein BJF93_14385 [Xaviernesmea oryzae]|uniref:FAD-dependent urate hydroxylase HpyO/Asp monooxygenase CreE-like FAD/NAD(P)-binding domain-containing protein n=1 Tax=Xaviernesmea oryzae TaxID=464029 RepID=A0A1Q9AXI9_9HYPH|nr:FAD/NAD(P)-binding protein [Xaviernesmea oryzae]OLP60167.1 hypothetical protein BJF93_14385 [Xaviernesmea oryzae]SEK30772.1 Uncharacterized NAD(P)/FAD-binding protein YdhS [Xaviernesmea oryzae]
MTVHDLSLPMEKGIDGRLKLAVIGRGFSGMMMAIALLRTLSQPFQLCLFDPQPTVSGGQALATARSTEILNSRARDLSVSIGDPKDFTRWLQANAEFRDAVSAAIPGFGQIFVPKSTFSDYVYQRFSEALSQRTDVSVRMSNDDVAGLERAEAGFILRFDDGRCEAFDEVMLATGYGIAGPKNPGGFANRLAEQPSENCRHIVVMGSGLRAVDQVLQLRDGGFAGRITLLSRRGFLPQPHTRLPADATFPTQPMPSSLREILRYVRQACAEAEENGWSWQAAMNGLRKRARALWSSLPPSEKRQFNRHLRAIYDAHRNRLPADVHARLERELGGGSTVLLKATALMRVPGGLKLKRADQAEAEIFPADEVIDCRCLAPDLSAPLISGLLASGLAVPDELALGLSVNPAGELLDDVGRSQGLFAIGPLGLGSLPDIDLVPEIVNQTYAAAERLEHRTRPQRRAG